MIVFQNEYSITMKNHVKTYLILVIINNAAQTNLKKTLTA